MTTSDKTCPTCGKPLPPDSPAGLCPACLLKRGMQTQSATLDSATPPAPRWTPPTPAELAPHFPALEILELLGRGGMGAVYKVRQKSLDRIAALKILPPHFATDSAFSERFTREARALARLSHPNIVTLYEFGSCAFPVGSGEFPETASQASGAETGNRKLETTSLYYFLMEYVDGTTLRQLITAARLSPREALAIVPQVCDALQYAHDSGIIHRDIKPENILLDRRGRVKVADFGLAKIAGGIEPAISTQASVSSTQSPSPVTEQGKIVGTPAYIAPEQSKTPDAVDHRADIYALGVVFYQMLTGELPPTPLTPPSKKAGGVLIDVRLDQVVLRALETDPTRRYQHASDVKTEVETIAQTPLPTTPIAPHPTPTHDAVAPDAPPRSSSPPEPSLASFPSKLSLAATLIGAFIALGAIANFNFMFGVDKTAMLVSGAIVFAAGCLGLAIRGTLVTTPGPQARRERVKGAIPIAQARREKATIALGAGVLLVSLVALAVVAVTYPAQAALPVMMIGLDLIGLAICGVCAAGYWPLSSPRYPRPNYYSRNLNAPPDAAAAMPPVIDIPEASPRPQPARPWAPFISAYVIYLALILLTANSLPAHVASHFDLAGHADGWMPFGGFLAFIILLPIGFVAFFLLFIAIIHRLPARYVQLPRKDYWLAPEHRGELRAELHRYFFALAALLTLFFAALHVLAVQANLRQPPVLDIGFLLFVLLGFLVALIILVVHLLLHFAEPGARRPAAGRWWKRWWFQAAAVVLFIVILRTFFVEALVIAGHSMEPELPEGSRVLVWKIGHTFHPGDLLVYRDGNANKVGRFLHVSTSNGIQLTVARNNQPDETFDRSRIIGKIISIYWRATPSPTAPITTATATAELPWGEPANGLAVRLRPVKPQWAAGETPTFLLDLRNRGDEPINYLGIAQEECHIILDGAYYAWSAPFGISTAGRRLKPGDEALGVIKLSLSDAWAKYRRAAQLPWRPGLPGVADAWGDHLSLTPGRHKLQVAFHPRDTAEALSNTVELLINDPDASTPSAAAVQSWVEDFFRHNYRDITARKTLSWGEPQRTPEGNIAIRYRYEAQILHSESLTIDEVFTFSPDGKFVSVEKVAPSPATATQPAESISCPLQVAIYEVHLRSSTNPRSSAEALSSAVGNQTEFDRALAAAGTAKLLYRMDQPIKLAGDNLALAASVPYVTATRTDVRGQTLNVVQYAQVGAKLKIAGQRVTGGLQSDIDLAVASVVGNPSAATGSDIHNTTLSHKGLMIPDKPLVVVSADAGSPDAEGKPIAYVARIVLGQPTVSAAPTAAGNTVCSLQAMIYELRLPLALATSLNTASLTEAAAQPTGFEEALAHLGKAKVLYTMDQSVKLAGDRILIESKTPVLTQMQLGASGQMIRTVQSQSVGAILNVAGRPLPDGPIAAELNLELSAMGDSAVNMAPKMPARLTRLTTIGHHGPVTPGKAHLIISIYADALDADGNAVAYIARIVLGKPRPATQPAATQPPSLEAQLKLQHAEALFRRAETAYRAGVGSYPDYLLAQRDRDVAAAELAGDTAQIRRVVLRYAETTYQHALAQAAVGLISQSEVDRLKLARDLAAVATRPAPATRPSP